MPPPVHQKKKGEQTPPKTKKHGEGVSKEGGVILPEVPSLWLKREDLSFSRKKRGGQGLARQEKGGVPFNDGKGGGMPSFFKGGALGSARVLSGFKQSLFFSTGVSAGFSEVEIKGEGKAREKSLWGKKKKGSNCFGEKRWPD